CLFKLELRRKSSHCHKPSQNSHFDAYARSTSHIQASDLRSQPWHSPFLPLAHDKTCTVRDFFHSKACTFTFDRASHGTADGTTCFSLRLHILRTVGALSLCHRVAPQRRLVNSIQHYLELDFHRSLL